MKPSEEQTRGFVTETRKFPGCIREEHPPFPVPLDEGEHDVELTGGSVPTPTTS